MKYKKLLLITLILILGVFLVINSLWVKAQEEEISAPTGEEVMPPPPAPPEEGFPVMCSKMMKKMKGKKEDMGLRLQVMALRKATLLDLSADQLKQIVPMLKDIEQSIEKLQDMNKDTLVKEKELLLSGISRQDYLAKQKELKLQEAEILLNIMQKRVDILKLLTPEQIEQLNECCFAPHLKQVVEERIKETLSLIIQVFEKRLQTIK